MELVEHPESRQASITPQAFRSAFKCSPAEFKAVGRIMSESGRVRDGNWSLDQAHAELQVLRMMTRGR